MRDEDRLRHEEEDEERRRCPGHTEEGARGAPRQQHGCRDQHPDEERIVAGAADDARVGEREQHGGRGGADEGERQLRHPDASEKQRLGAGEAHHLRQVQQPHQRSEEEEAASLAGSHLGNQPPPARGSL